MRILFILIVILTLPGMSLTAQSGLRTSWGNDNLRKESRINIDVFPNPATDHLTVRLNSTKGGAMNVNLIDAVGKMVQANQVTVSTGTQNIELNLNGIAPGIYELQMVKDGKASSTRLVVR